MQSCSSVVIKRSNSSSPAHSQPGHSRSSGGETSDSVIISKGEPPVDLNPTGRRSDSDSSVHVKCVSESELSRSPTSVEGEVPIGRQGSHYCINAKVIVYAVLSGMISFLPDGTIHGCNHHFVLMLFGYSQQELLKKVHTTLFVPSRCTGMKLEGVLVQSCSRPHIHVASFPGLPTVQF